jgi:hypothetical protein
MILVQSIDGSFPNQIVIVGAHLNRIRHWCGLANMWKCTATTNSERQQSDDQTTPKTHFRPYPWKTAAEVSQTSLNW